MILMSLVIYYCLLLIPWRAGRCIDLGVPAEEVRRGDAPEAVRNPDAVLHRRDQIGTAVPKGYNPIAILYIHIFIHEQQRIQQSLQHFC